MDSEQFDVVIVGSGIAGAVLAKALTRENKKVLILEAGLAAGVALEPEKAFKTYKGYVNTFHDKAVPATNGPYPNIPEAPSSNVLEIQSKTPYDTGYLVQKGPLPFASDGLRAPGGTTLHWLGNVPRMLPNDFRMKTLYGHGVDWPFSYQDMVPYYELAEREIGVSGDVQAQVGPDMGPQNYSKDYVFPMQQIPQSYQDKVWMLRTQNLSVTVGGQPYIVTCVSMPQGRNSVPNPKYPVGEIVWDAKKGKFSVDHAVSPYPVTGSVWSPYTGERCEGNASCVPICPVQAKYNALKTLNKAKKEHLRIETQAVASKVLIDHATGEVTGIEYKKYASKDDPTHTTHVAKGRIYILAGSAMENPKLLLMSKAANSSGQVGRNLMDHMVMLAWGLFPEKVYPYRGPGCTTYIPTFRDGLFRKEHAAWISPLDNWGWSWPTGAPGSDITNAFKQGLFGKALREEIASRVTRQALLHFECEQLPEADNRITIEPDKYVDALGNPRPVIHYDASPYMRKAFAAARKVSEQIFAANGIEDYTEYTPDQHDHVIWEGKGYTFWGAGHIVGTHCMGNDPKTSVVNPKQQCWDHPNLYLVGCGNMPTLGTSNPTLTMVALTFMAAENVLKQLEGRH